MNLASSRLWSLICGRCSVKAGVSGWPKPAAVTSIGFAERHDQQQRAIRQPTQPV